MDIAFDLSGFKFMNFSQYQLYQYNWNTFNRIQGYNSNISTLVTTAGAPGVYYQFSNNLEKNTYTQGQFLHQQRYPASNWNSIS